MKKIILSIAILMGVSIANTTFGSDGFVVTKFNTNVGDLNIQTYEGLKFKLTLDELTKKTNIAIKNKEGEVFYNEFVGVTKNFSKVYDLSNLPDGDYFFEVIIGNNKQIKFFQILTEVKRTAVSN